MSTLAARLYRSLRGADPASQVVVSTAGWSVTLTDGELLAALTPVELPPIEPPPANAPVYLSQWLPEASARQNDCGPTCVAMFLRGRGDSTAINNLRTTDPTGLTNAAQLQSLLKAHGVASSIEKTDPNLPLDVAAKPYSMLLINVAPLKPYIQDKSFGGWHWLIFVSIDPDDPSMAITLDPDYWGGRINEGNHKRYPTVALRSAWRPYGSQTQATALAVSLDPSEIPAFTPMNVVITATSLNIRSGPGTSFASVGTISQNKVARVVEERDGWYRLDNSDHWIYAGWTRQQ